MNSKSLIIILILPLFCLCCNSKKGNELETNLLTEETRTTEWSNGIIKTKINYIGDKKNGWSFSYDKNGNIHQKILYKDDLKNGEAFIYHPNGKIRQHSNYFNNKLNGKRIKYFSNGIKASEITYVNDVPCSDLVEYLMDGTPQKNTPNINFREINNILLDGTLILRVAITGEFRKATIYKANGEIKDCNDFSTLFEYPMKQNYVDIVYPVPKGTFRMQEVFIASEITTRKGNPLILQKKYNLAIDNR